ncbi:hypothetical protein EV122DRAFT_256872 [Schizophyllum commune]
MSDPKGPQQSFTSPLFVTVDSSFLLVPRLYPQPPTPSSVCATAFNSSQNARSCRRRAVTTIGNFGQLLLRSTDEGSRPIWRSNSLRLMADWSSSSSICPSYRCAWSTAERGLYNNVDVLHELFGHDSKIGLTKTSGATVMLKEVCEVPVKTSALVSSLDSFRHQNAVVLPRLFQPFSAASLAVVIQPFVQQLAANACMM